MITIDTLKDDGTVDVVNSGRKHSPTGPENSINGIAERPDDKEPGKLTVQFPGGPKGNCKYHWKKTV